MFIEESEYQTFDPGRDRTFLTWGYFYKHSNLPDLGDDYHICDSMPEASYVYREQTNKEIFDPAGSYVLLIKAFYKHSNPLGLA